MYIYTYMYTLPTSAAGERGAPQRCWLWKQPCRAGLWVRVYVCRSLSFSLFLSLPPTLTSPLTRTHTGTSL